MYNISLIRYLYQQGYRQKLICLITGYPQSYISRNCDTPRPYIPTLDTANEEQLTRKYVIDTICKCKVLNKKDGKMFSVQDEAYIKLLDFCLVDKELIRKLYCTTSAKKISHACHSNKDIIKKFEPEGIDITKEEFALLLAQIFVDNEEQLT